MGHDDPFFSFCKAKFAIWAVVGNFRTGFYQTKMRRSFQAEQQELVVGQGYLTFKSA
jgi:hypothetical protein